MARIEGWIKDYEKSDEIVWTQNKYNPLRFKAKRVKSSNGKMVWRLEAIHRSYEGNTRLFAIEDSKADVKSKARFWMERHKVPKKFQRA